MKELSHRLSVIKLPYWLALGAAIFSASCGLDALDGLAGNGARGGAGPVLAGNGNGVGGAGGNSSADGGTSADAGTSGSGGASAGAAGSDIPLPDPIALPIAVDDYYVPSGGMGDAQQAGNVDFLSDIDCKPRPMNAPGRCWKAIYEPSNQGWAGYYWQYPVNNWGALRGLRIAAGATAVRFYAASNLEGLLVSFLVGVISPGQVWPHTDVYAEKFTPEGGLTTELTLYTIPLPPMTSPVEVIGGFGWTLGTGDVGQIAIPKDQPIELYIDGIEWI